MKLSELKTKILEDGVVDEQEKTFLRTLRAQAKSLSSGFKALFQKCCLGE